MGQAVGFARVSVELDRQLGWMGQAAGWTRLPGGPDGRMGQAAEWARPPGRPSRRSSLAAGRARAPDGPWLKARLGGRMGQTAGCARQPHG